MTNDSPAHLTVLRPGQFTDGPVRAEHAAPRAEHREAVRHVRPANKTSQAQAFVNH